MADSISRQFARWTANLKYEDLSPEVVDKMKAFILHAMTSAVLGGPDPRSHHAVEFTMREEGKPDGATVLWFGGKATRIGATFANAEIMHNSGLIDSYRMLTHPGPVLVPAALANAELEGRNGKELITALAAGYEFIFRLCDEFIPSTAARGFRPSPLYCTMGAALTTGKLLGLDEDGLNATIAFAANATSALNQSSTSSGRDGVMHEPVAARNGVLSAVMARETGENGSEESIEGVAGFYNAFTGNNKGELSYSFTGKTQVDYATITEGLGKEYKLLTAMFRMYPFAAYNQPVIDLMAEMKAEHQINHEEIEELLVHMNWIETLYPSPQFPSHPNWDQPRGGDLPRPTTHWYASHSAVNGGYPMIGGKTYGPTGWDLAADTAVHEFMNSKVHLVPEKDRAMFSPAITVKMKDGTVYEGEYPYHPRLEWNFDQLAKRLEDCLPLFALGEAGLAKIVETVRNTDQLASVDGLYEVVKQP